MTNQEIVNQINDLLHKNLNYCDYILELKKINKEYKKSSFYKKTLYPLKSLVMDCQKYQLYNLDYLFQSIQNKINELDINHLIELLNKLQESFALDFENNKELLSILSDFKEDINISLDDNRGE